MGENEAFFDAAVRVLQRHEAKSDADELRELRDERRIQRVLAAYAYYYDGGNLDALDQVFAEDAILINLLGEFHGRPAVIEAVSKLASVLDERRHLLMNTVIAFHGPDRAEAISYLFSVASMAGGTAYGTTGTYVDVLERRDGRWLIVERRVDAALGHRVELLPADYDRFASIRS